MHSCEEIHYQAALRILAYLKNDPRCGLFYLRREFICMEAFSISRYVGGHEDEKSISRYYKLFGKNLGTWRSQNKHGISLSSIEVKNMSFPMRCVGYVYFFKSLVFEYCDKKLSSFSTIILIFMNSPSISRLTIVLLTIRYLMASSPLVMFDLPICWRTFSPKGKTWSLRLHFLQVGLV